jgi:hypothetical protein
MTIPSETKKDCLLSGLSGQVVGNLFYVLGNGRHGLATQPAQIFT